MEYIAGIALALCFCAAAAGLGMDRQRAFYPAVAIAGASCDLAFAVVDGRLLLRPFYREAPVTTAMASRNTPRTSLHVQLGVTLRA